VELAISFNHRRTNRFRNLRERSRGSRPTTWGDGLCDCARDSKPIFPYKRYIGDPKPASCPSFTLNPMGQSKAIPTTAARTVSISFLRLLRCLSVRSGLNCVAPGRGQLKEDPSFAVSPDVVANRLNPLPNVIRDGAAPYAAQHIIEFRVFARKFYNPVDELTAVFRQQILNRPGGENRDNFIRWVALVGGHNKPPKKFTPAF